MVGMVQTAVVHHPRTDGSQHPKTADRPSLMKPLAKKEEVKKGPKNDGAWAWKAVAPKEGEPHKKTFRGKKYIYCPRHGDTKWVLEVNNKGIEHATGCRAKVDGDTVAMSSTSGSTPSKSVFKTPTKRDQMIAEALANVMEQEGISAVTEDEDIMDAPKK
jgi:hypothetical protein